MLLAFSNSEAEVSVLFGLLNDFLKQLLVLLALVENPLLEIPLHAHQLSHLLNA